jgi:hypothetical protein
LVVGADAAVDGDPLSQVDLKGAKL